MDDGHRLLRAGSARAAGRTTRRHRSAAHRGVARELAVCQPSVSSTISGSRALSRWTDAAGQVAARRARSVLPPGGGCADPASCARVAELDHGRLAAGGQRGGGAARPIARAQASWSALMLSETSRAKTTARPCPADAASARPGARTTSATTLRRSEQDRRRAAASRSGAVVSARRTAPAARRVRAPAGPTAVSGVSDCAGRSASWLIRASQRRATRGRARAAPPPSSHGQRSARPLATGWLVVGDRSSNVGAGRGAMSDSAVSNGAFSGAAAISDCVSRNDVALLISSGNASDFSRPETAGSKVRLTTG